MSKALTKSNPLAKMSGTTLLIGVVLVGLLVWYLMKKKPVAATYQNLETWDIKYSVDGLPTTITIHRDAKQK